MKLRNKKTGEIGYFCFANWNDPVLIIVDDNGIQLAKYNSLAELNDCWEDAPDEYWFISCCGDVEKDLDEGVDFDKTCKEIGNYFKTKEAEKAVEKLKAVKRLKDKGLRFLGYYHSVGETKSKGEIGFEMDDYKCTKQDLDLLFGGEE